MRKASERKKLAIIKYTFAFGMYVLPLLYAIVLSLLNLSIDTNFLTIFAIRLYGIFLFIGVVISFYYGIPIYAMKNDKFFTIEKSDFSSGHVFTNILVILFSLFFLSYDF